MLFYKLVRALGGFGHSYRYLRTEMRFAKTGSKSSSLPSWKGYTPIEHYRRLVSLVGVWDTDISNRSLPFVLPQSLDRFVMLRSMRERLAQHPLTFWDQLHDDADGTHTTNSKLTYFQSQKEEQKRDFKHYQPFFIPFDYLYEPSVV